MVLKTGLENVFVRNLWSDIGSSHKGSFWRGAGAILEFIQSLFNRKKPIRYHEKLRYREIQ
jgi:hypothetical protein